MGHRIALAMAVVLAVAGCADILVYEVSPPRLSYFDGDFEYATHKGAIVTKIGGDPFAIGSKRFGAPRAALGTARKRAPKRIGNAGTGPGGGGYGDCRHSGRACRPAFARAGAGFADGGRATQSAIGPS